MEKIVTVARDRDDDDTNFLDMDDVEIKVEHEIQIGDFETETEIKVEQEEEVIVNFASTTGELIRTDGNEVPEDPLSLTSFDEHKYNSVSRKSKRARKSKLTKPSKSKAKKTKTVNVKRTMRMCTEKPKYTSSGTYNYNCQKCSLNFRTEVQLQTHISTAHTTISVRNSSNARTKVKDTEPVKSTVSETMSIISFACPACSCKFSSKMGLDIHECTATPIPVRKKSSNKTKRTTVTAANVAKPDLPLENIPTEPEIEIKIETEYDLSPNPPSPPNPSPTNDDESDSGNDSDSQKKSLRPSRKRNLTRSSYGKESESGSEPEAPDPKRKRRQKLEGSCREIDESDDFLQDQIPSKRNPKNIRNSTKRKTKTTNPRKSKRSTATKCSHCDKTFSNSQKRESHIKTDHPDIQPTILCEDCSLLFYHNSAYLTHKSEHSLPHPHACRYCDEKFTTVRKLREHRKTHPEIPKKTFKKGMARKCLAEECGLVFYTKRSLYDHRCEVHGARRRPRKIKESTSLLCKECGKLFSTQESLYRHEKVHDFGLPRLTCPVSGCGKSFLYKSKYEEHVAIHLPDRPFKCDDCEKTFQLESRLKYHRRRTHDDRAKTHVCKVCSRGFIIKSKLTTHERIHTGERPYVCQHDVNCGARFNDACGLSNHKRFVHGDENTKKSRYKHLSKGGPKTFPCVHCGKMYRTRRILKRHEISLHAGQTDRPIPKYVCKYCGKLFLSQYPLDVHERIHTGEKPFPCPHSHCPKDFRSKELLAIHTKSHLK